MNPRQKRNLIRIVVAAVLMVALAYVPLSGMAVSYTHLTLPTICSV